MYGLKASLLSYPQTENACLDRHVFFNLFVTWCDHATVYSFNECLTTCMKEAYCSIIENNRNSCLDIKK